MNFIKHVICSIGDNPFAVPLLFAIIVGLGGILYMIFQVIKG